jgi:hypothetical protein
MSEEYPQWLTQAVRLLFVPEIPASFPNSVPISVSSTMSYGLNTLGVRCPVIRIATDSLMPARRKFRAAQRRKS